MQRYRTVLIDPPYLERGAGKIKRGADKHYPLMSLNEIKSYLQKIRLYEKIAPHCHIYLWVTNNHLLEGIELLQWLGFRYITNLVWVKDKFGLGYYFRGQHELCLFGVRGKLKPQHKDFKRIYPEKRWSGTIQKPNLKTPTTLIKAKRTKHSQKPYEMYKLIETVSQPPRLEIFARHKREGWDCLGLEVSKETQEILKCN